MAGGYRCSLGHTWNPSDGLAATACPVCGDVTVVMVLEDDPPVFITASGSGGGPDATQSIAGPQVAVVSPDHAPTVAFAPPNPTDTPDPSFSSLVVLLP